MQALLTRLVEARDITDVNLAALQGLEELELEELTKEKTQPSRLTKWLWMIALALVISDLLPIGPVDLGLIPDVRPIAALTGDPALDEAGHALYHVDKLDKPHVLGVRLPWGS